MADSEGNTAGPDRGIAGRDGGPAEQLCGGAQSAPDSPEDSNEELRLGLLNLKASIERMPPTTTGAGGGTSSSAGLLADLGGLGPVVTTMIDGLRSSSTQVVGLSLDALLALVPKAGSELGSFGPQQLVVALVEALGDSRASVRDKAIEALVLLVPPLGLPAVMEGLRPALRNRNIKMKQQAAVLLAKLVEMATMPQAGRAVGAQKRPEEGRRLITEGLSVLLSDASSDVRSAAVEGLSKLMALEGPGLLKQLEDLGVRRAQLRLLASSSGQQQQEDDEGGSGEASSSGPNGGVKKSHKNEKEGVVMEHVEAQVEVAALHVYTASELASEMEQVGRGLQASEDQWQARVEALQRLQQLAVGGAVQLEAFVPAIRAINELVAAQVTSLRSALSKEGCTTVSVLAQTLADAFAPLAELWTPVVLRMTQTNVLTIALSASQCLRCMVCCTRNGFGRMLPLLLSGASDKTDTLRQRSVVGVTLALFLWDPAVLDKHVDGICRMIKTAVADKKEPVRVAARQCFWVLSWKFPTQAESLLDVLDSEAPRSRKLLEKEKDGVTPAAIQALVPTTRFRVIGGGEPPRPSASSARSTDDAALASSTLPLPPTPDSAVAPYHHHVSSTSGAMDRPQLQPSSSGSSFSAGGPLPPPPSAGPSRTVASSSSSSSSSRRQSMSMSGPVRVMGPPARHTHDAKPAQPPPPGPAPPASRSALRVAMGGTPGAPTTSAGGGLSSSGPSAVGPASMRPASPDRPPPALSSSSMSGPPSAPPGSMPPPHQRGLAGPQRVARPQPQPSPGHNTAQSAQRVRGGDEDDDRPSTTSSRGAAAVAEAAPSGTRGGGGGGGGGGLSSAAAWESLLREADSPGWAQRARCFEEVASRIREFVGSSSSSSSTPAEPFLSESGGHEEPSQPPPSSFPAARVVSVVLRHMQDPIFRVMQAAMEALMALVVHRPSCLACSLDSVLPLLLTKLSDPKDQVRSLANTALDQCRQAFDPALLVASLARTLHEQPDRTKTAALELLVRLLPLPSSAAYLSAQPSALRSLLHKLAAILANTSSRAGGGGPAPLNLQRAACQCSVAVYHLDPDALMDQHAPALPADLQLALRRALSSAVPDLDTRHPPSAYQPAARSARPTPAPGGSHQHHHRQQGSAHQHQRGGSSASNRSGGGGQGSSSTPAAPAPASAEGSTATPQQATPVLAGRGMSAPSPSSSSSADPNRRSHVLAGGGGMDSLPGPLMAVDGGGHVAAAAAASSTSAWLLHQHMHAASSGGGSSSKAAYGSHVAMPAAPHYSHSYGQDDARLMRASSGRLEELLPSVMTTLSDRQALQAVKTHALKTLAMALGRASASSWDQHVGQVVHVLLEQLHCPDTGHQPAAVQPFLLSANDAYAHYYDGGGLCQEDKDDDGEQLPSGGGHGPLGVMGQPSEELAKNSRFMAIQGLRLLIKQRPLALQPFVEVLMGRLLDCAADRYRVLVIAERVLEQLASCASPDRCFQTMSTFLTAPGLPLPRLLMALRALAKYTPRVSSPALLAALPGLAPVLVDCFNSKEIFLRLTVVTSLVEMYLVVGDGLLPHLAALRPHQLKLITAYVEKHRREQPRRKQQQEQRRRQQQQQQQQQTYEEHKPSGQ